MPQLNNYKYLKGFRKELRNNLTPAEVVLWKLLKSKQLEGLKFRRQHSFGAYIMDFYCPAQKLCIELDGQGHFTAEGIERDEKRTAYLNSFGIQVLRFENKDVLHFQENVLESIKNSISR